MSSKNAAKFFYEDQQSNCEWCEALYVIKSSDAYEMSKYCCGECEVLGDESESQNDE